MNYHLVVRSDNPKTGPIPVSTSSRHTCPDACPLKRNHGGCYGEFGPLRWHWNKVTSGQRGGSFDQFLAEIRNLPTSTLWRHNQVGDLPGRNNTINAGQLRRLAEASSSLRGFTYTHKPVLRGQAQASVVRRNKAAIRASNRPGFTINLSADSLDEADQMADLAVAPVVTIVPSSSHNHTTPRGRRVVICPAQTHEGVMCQRCGLCARHDRQIIIGFRAHGTLQKAVDQMVFADNAKQNAISPQGTPR